MPRPRSATLLQDWAALPKDVLHRVFENLFEFCQWDEIHEIDEFTCHPKICPPLETALFQIASLRLVCKHWAQAWAESPPPISVEISDPREIKVAKCINALPVKALSIRPQRLPPVDVDETSDNENDQEAFGDAEERRMEAGDAWSGLVIDCVHNRFDGLCIGQLNELEFLYLDCSKLEGPALFNSEPIKSLQNLTDLHLSGVEEFDLSSLPRSLRNIELYFPFLGNLDGHAAFSMVPPLPDYLSLDQYSILSLNEVGIGLGELWNCCKRINIHAGGCLIGVPVPDPELIHRFERPYREGRYVPPHILGDFEALELSNRAADATLDYMLTGMSHSLLLEQLSICEKAQSLKLVPAAVGTSGASVKFLQSVCRHKTAYLYGCSEVEMIDRLQRMVMEQKLTSSALELERGSESFVMNIKKEL